MYQFKGKEYPCCASLTMGIIGGKWKTVILYHLMDGTLRYNELRKLILQAPLPTTILQREPTKEFSLKDIDLPLAASSYYILTLINLI